jgi:CheY-like chemotaxis protein
MDDEEMIRSMAGDMLSHLQYEVYTVKDGLEAISAIKEAKLSGEPFDAVIMDLTIPGGVGGKEAIGKVREIDTRVKAIASSGYANDPILSDFEKYGFDGVVSKPYGIEKLSEVMYKVISSRIPQSNAVVVLPEVSVQGSAISCQQQKE